MAATKTKKIRRTATHTHDIFGRRITKGDLVAIPVNQYGVTMEISIVEELYLDDSKGQPYASRYMFLDPNGDLRNYASDLNTDLARNPPITLAAMGIDESRLILQDPADLSYTGTDKLVRIQLEPAVLARPVINDSKANTYDGMHLLLVEGIERDKAAQLIQENRKIGNR